MAVVPEEATFVQRIFARQKEGLGAKAIAAQLNTEEVPTRGGRPWIFSTIQGMLHNEKYEGNVEYYLKSTERESWVEPGQHEAILPPKVAKRVG